MAGKKYWYVMYYITYQYLLVSNITRVHKTTNVPVVFMALILNGFEECNIITRGIGRGGP